MAARRPPEEEDELGLDYLLPVYTIAARLFGALTVVAGFGWWLHHTFVVPSRPRRTSP
jgi:hypothetical protein